MHGTFFENARRFGAKRAMMLWDRRDRVREYVKRQKMLAGLGFPLAALAIATSNVFITVASVLIFIAASTEAQRMQATGRYWNTERGMRKVHRKYVRPLQRNAYLNSDGNWYDREGRRVNIPHE